MPAYEFTIQKPPEQVTVYADDLASAAEDVRRDWPDYKLSTVAESGASGETCEQVIEGFCTVCSGVIVDGDDWLTDDDGRAWHTKCAPADASI